MTVSPTAEATRDELARILRGRVSHDAAQPLPEIGEPL